MNLELQNNYRTLNISTGHLVSLFACITRVTVNGISNLPKSRAKSPSKKEELNHEFRLVEKCFQFQV